MLNKGRNLHTPKTNAMSPARALRMACSPSALAEARTARTNTYGPTRLPRPPPEK